MNLNDISRILTRLSVFTFNSCHPRRVAKTINKTPAIIPALSKSFQQFSSENHNELTFRDNYPTFLEWVGAKTI